MTPEDLTAAFAEALSPHELLALARCAALRDGQRDLACAVHALLMLDLIGGLAGMAEEAASRSPRHTRHEAPGDGPRAVN